MTTLTLILTIGLLLAVGLLSIFFRHYVLTFYIILVIALVYFYLMLRFPARRR